MLLLLLASGAPPIGARDPDLILPFRALFAILSHVLSQVLSQYHVFFPVPVPVPNLFPVPYRVHDPFLYPNHDSFLFLSSSPSRKVLAVSPMGHR